MLSGVEIHPTLPVSDIERAKRWYQDKLGLTPTDENPGGVRFGDGLSEFGLYPSEFAGTNQATAAGFVVDDIEATVSALRERGVTFEEYDMPGLKTENGIATLGPQRGAWFKDSEGNILAISQPLPAEVLAAAEAGR